MTGGEGAGGHWVGLQREPGCFSPAATVSLGFMCPFPGRQQTVLILVYVRVSGEANSPLPQSSYFYSYATFHSEAPRKTILTDSGAAPPVHKGENFYLCKFWFLISAYGIHTDLGR